MPDIWIDVMRSCEFLKINKIFSSQRVGGVKAVIRAQAWIMERETNRLPVSSTPPQAGRAFLQASNFVRKILASLKRSYLTGSKR